jgi:hypothetical protein
MRAVAVRLLVLTMLIGGAAASSASAQAADPRAPALVFGVFGGPGRRTTSGTFDDSALPADAEQPSEQTTATLGLHAGVKFLDRVAAMAVWDQSWHNASAGGKWGSFTLHAVGRVWITRRLWVEGGGGVSELGFKPANQANPGISRFWAPGGQASVGGDVLQGRRVAVTVAGRYSTATFNGLRIDDVVLQIGLFGRR